jgi:hypothetical protein
LAGKLVFWLGSLLALSLTLFVAVVRFYPRDESEMRRLLAPPDGCAMPCWQGIRPGITTAGDAVALLSQHAWGGRIIMTYFDAGKGDGIIAWTWNADGLEEIARLHGVRLHVRDGVVYNISLPPGIPLRDVWLAFGDPSEGEWAIVDRPYTKGYRIQQELSYGDSGVYVSSRAACPASLNELWDAFSTVQLGEPVFHYVLEPVIERDSGYSMRAMLRQQTACR